MPVANPPYEIWPAYPPPPSPRYRPFQVSFGSQTSIRICGDTVRATRQKAGRFASRGPAAGAYSPAAISSAAVTVVAERDIFASSAHDVAALAAGAAAASANHATITTRSR